VKRTALIVCLLVLAVANTLSQQRDASALSGPYLGQKPPGLRPEVFAPGIVSTSDHEFSCFDSYEKGTDDMGRLFVCFRNKDGSWSKAVDLGEEINFSPNICATLSPDGKYLFFGSRGGIPDHKADIYWVSARIIEDFRPKEMK
jgi:hypothetical protein